MKLSIAGTQKLHLFHRLSVRQVKHPAGLIIERAKRRFSPNSPEAEWGSQFFQEIGFVPSSFPGSGKVPGLVSLLFWHPVPSSFPAARVPGLVSLLFWNPVLSSFVRFRGLSPYSFGILFHHHFLVPARVPGLVSLLFWQAMSPYSFFGILFHYYFLIPAKVPGLVSLLFWHPVPSSFPGSARVPGLASLLFWQAMSPYSFGILFHHYFLIRAKVPGLASLLFWHPVQSSCPGSG